METEPVRPIGERRVRAARRIRDIAVAGLVGVALGCVHAADPEADARPADPFPRWVEALEPGLTTVEAVRARFGEPRERRASPRGGIVLRYRHVEIHGAEDARRRSEVSADAQGMPDEPSLGERIARGWHALLGGFERIFLYPGRQPRPPWGRPQPATIHALELGFGPDGRLERTRYTRQAGYGRVPPGR